MVVAVDPVPGLLHDRHHLAGQRVARLRAVHGDDQLVAVLLDEAVGSAGVGLGHGAELAKNENVF